MVEAHQVQDHGVQIVRHSAIEKTFYSFFNYPDVLETPLNHSVDEGENPRQIEKEQIILRVGLHRLRKHADGTTTSHRRN